MLRRVAGDVWPFFFVLANGNEMIRTLPVLGLFRLVRSNPVAGVMVHVPVVAVPFSAKPVPYVPAPQRPGSDAFCDRKRNWSHTQPPSSLLSKVRLMVRASSAKG